MLPFLIATIPAHQTGRWLLRKKYRQAMFDLAMERSIVTRKPLLVLGDPDGGVTHGDYGHGDVCMDLTGCPGAAKGVKGDLSNGLPFASDSHIVFVSYILEYVDRLGYAWEEIMRVAGGKPENVFVLHLNAVKDASVFFLYPGARWVILQAPPQGPNLVYKPFVKRLPLKRKVL